MRLLRPLLTALVCFFVSGIAYGQETDDCRSTCAADKNAANAQCPIAQDGDPDSARARDDCRQGNETAYANCLAACPPPALSNPGPSREPYSPGAPMGY